jgi:hypothetical protein
MGCDKQAALVQPNHDPGGIITWVRRQKHAENGKQQQEDDPDLKSLLHKNHDSTVWGPPSAIIPTFVRTKRGIDACVIRRAKLDGRDGGLSAFILICGHLRCPAAKSSYSRCLHR